LEEIQRKEGMVEEKKLKGKVTREREKKGVKNEMILKDFSVFC